MSESPLPQDPYTLLGVGADADEQQLRRAYRRQALLHHPDRNDGDSRAAERFEQIQAAYAEILRRRAAALSPEALEQRRRLAQRLSELEAEVRAGRSANSDARRRRLPRAPRRAGGAGGVPPPAEPLVLEVNSLIDGLDRLASMIDRPDEGRPRPR